MRKRYWERNGIELQGLLDSGELIVTPPHEEALARLSHLVDQRRRFGLMLGPAGTGKSLLLRTIAREAQRSGREVTSIDLFGIDSHDFLWQLAVALRLGPTERWPRAVLWRAVCDHWHALHSARMPSVLLLDHLERAEIDCLNLVERLLHLDVANDGCLTVLTAGRGEDHDCLFADLFQYSELRIELPNLNRHETESFIRELFRTAEDASGSLSLDACETVFEITHGSPREIIRVCNLALAAARRDDVGRIDSSILEEVASELPRFGQKRTFRERPVATW